MAVTELVGRLDGICWRAEDGSAFIGTVRLATAELATVKGPTDAGPSPQPGCAYRFFGRWEEHERYGRQFAFQSYCAVVSSDRKGVIAYLISIADNVGEKRAEKLWEAFGPFAVQTLRENPEAVANKGIMSIDDAREASQSLHDEAGFEPVKIELLSLFAGRGFQAGKLIKACLQRWGGRAAEMVRRNPYVLLLRKFPSCGWKRIDKLYIDLGHRKNRHKRQALCAVYHLRLDSTGHTWFPAQQVGEAIASTIGSGADPLRALRLALRARLLVRRNDATQVWLAEAGKGRNEATVATRIKEMLTWKPLTSAACAITADPLSEDATLANGEPGA